MKTDRMASNEPHWVEELFPPTFGLTVNEILDDNSEFNIERTKDAQENQDKPNVFQKVAKKISPLDTSAIKNVYERVWLMEYMEERMKHGEEEDLSQQGTRRLQRYGNKCDAETSTSDIYEQTSLHDPCIWSSEEIEVLRAVFKTASTQNIELKAQLAATTQELDKLKEKYKTLAKNREDNRDEHIEVKKANQRFKIMCDNLKAQNVKAERKISELDREMQALREDCLEKSQAMHRLQEEYELEKVKHKKTQNKLAASNKEALREQILREENLKSMHEQDIAFLQKKISEIQLQLETERKDHERSKKGLDHLRTHFSSLPTVGEDIPQNVVKNDQLKKWSYS